MSIFLTGSSGFVGKNIISYFGKEVAISKYERDSVISIQEDIVIHLAGKAHDLKKVNSDTDYYLVNTELTKQVFDSFTLTFLPICFHFVIYFKVVFQR